MTKLTLSSVKTSAYRIVIAQMLVALFAAVVALMVSGILSAQAVLLGSAVYIVPGACYAAKLLSNVSAHAVNRIMLVFYLGEIVKLLASVGAFVLFFQLFSLPLVPYFLGYLLAAVSFCVAPLFVLSTPQTKKVAG